jgi:drug/metabolite transporter (DMT)-like permease
MEHLASVFILLSGMTHAVVNAILKAGRDKVSGRAMIDGFSALLVAPAAFLVPLPAGAWGWLGVSMLIHSLYLLSLIRAFQHADLTVAYPISRGLAPMLTAAGATFLFGEPVTPLVALGIAAVASGVLLVGVSHRVDRRGILWALATGACVAGYTVVDAQGVRAAPTAASYIVWIFLVLGVVIAGALALWRGRDFVSALREQWRPGFAAGTLSIVSYGLALLALRLGATPRLAALRETSILFATVIAVVFLKERLSRGRAAGVAVIAAGAIALIAAP